MTQTAFAGPLVSFGAQAGSPGDNNPDRGPSLLDQGVGILDPRLPFTYQSSGRYYGWLGIQDVPTIAQIPSTAAVNNIAASAVPAAGTAFTLVSTTGAGITAGASVVNALTGQTVTGLLAIDGPSSYVGFGTGNGDGTGGRCRIWDPTTLIARCVRVVSAGNDSTGTYLVSGYDIYGYPMTQLLTGANAGTATTTKAFKYIASVLPAGTLSGSAITIGTTDVIGLPLRADFFPETGVYMNNAWVTASTGFTAAVTTSPATNLTGDVRGTYTLQTASNGTLKLTMFGSPSVANISSSVGLTGVQQV
jgi:hypothetical protein